MVVSFDSTVVIGDYHLVVVWNVFLCQEKENLQTTKKSEPHADTHTRRVVLWAGI